MGRGPPIERMFSQTAPAVQPHRLRVSGDGPRACPACGGALRFSHTVYAGRGETVAVSVCSQCGAVERGRPRAADASTPGRRGAARERQRAGRRPLDQGPVDNRVIDEEAARRLREQLGLE
jgi:hypothetical protein